MKIDIILPYKEIFSETKASAVSLTVKNAIEYSEFKSNIKVYGQTTKNPFFMLFKPFNTFLPIMATYDKDAK